MRAVLLALAVAIVVAPAARGQSPAGYVMPSVPAPRDPLPRFTIAPRGVPLAPVGLPLPPIGLQPPPSREPARPHRRPAHLSWPMMVIYVPQPAPPPAAPVEPDAKPAERVPATGRLILDVEPAAADVFSDGYYVGVPSDFGAARGGGPIEAGAHRLDITAIGYEPASVDLRITAGQTLTYRVTLKALAPSAAVAPTTFYLIPGCYMGNIPPRDARLPASCDQSRAITWRP